MFCICLQTSSNTKETNHSHTIANGLGFFEGGGFFLEDTLNGIYAVISSFRNTSEPCPANTSLAGISIHEGPLEAEAAVVAYQHRPAFLPGEQVASSQGSPVFSPAFHMRKLLQIQGEELDLLRPKTPLCGISHESPLTTAVTPATFKVRNF